MNRTKFPSPRGWGRQVLASATLLILPAVAIAWLSPGLVTASSEAPGVEGWLAFNVPIAPASAAPSDQPVDPAASQAEDWAYTRSAASARRLAERKTLRAVYVLGRKTMREQGFSHADLEAYRQKFIADRNALRAFQRANPNTPASNALTDPADLRSPFN